MLRKPAIAGRLSVAAMLTIAAVLSAAVAVGATPGAPTSPQAPGRPDAATGAYIVVLEDSVLSPAVVAGQHAARFGADVGSVFSNALRAYTADLTAGEAANLSADPGVAWVEPDRVLHIAQNPQTVPTGVGRIFAPGNPNIDIDGTDDARIDVDVAVIDTGIAEHGDLNVVSRATCALGICMDGGSDLNGHGTHVAGTIGAIDNGIGVVGVAPGARLHAVQVCTPTGSCLTSAIIAGINYVTARAGTIEVANVSLGGPGTSAAMDQAISNSVNAGVVYAVAAGNDDADAAGFTPASHPDVITVSAVADSDGQPGGLGGSTACRPSQDDVRADFSNFGGTVEVAAPGVCILSTWNDGDYNTISGTSMATPHVAGAAALLASGPRDPASRDDVLAIRQRIVDTGNFGWTDDSGDGVQEPLLDVGDPAQYPGPG
ncbi:MAG: S8 family serine peptidase [Acidimicrobiales bacterium]